MLTLPAGTGMTLSRPPTGGEPVRRRGPSAPLRAGAPSRPLPEGPAEQADAAIGYAGPEPCRGAQAGGLESTCDVRPGRGGEHENVVVTSPQGLGEGGAGGDRHRGELVTHARALSEVAEVRHQPVRDVDHGRGAGTARRRCLRRAPAWAAACAPTSALSSAPQRRESPPPRSRLDCNRRRPAAAAPSGPVAHMASPARAPVRSTGSPMAHPVTATLTTTAGPALRSPPTTGHPYSRDASSRPP